MELLDRRVHCPYCGEMIDIMVDDSVEVQEYYEDCQVCCRPIRINVDIDPDGSCRVALRRDDE